MLRRPPAAVYLPAASPAPASVSAFATGAWFTAATLTVTVAGALVAVPSLARYVKFAAPWKLGVGVNVTVHFFNVAATPGSCVLARRVPRPRQRVRICHWRVVHGRHVDRHGCGRARRRPVARQIREVRGAMEVRSRRERHRAFL